jgi:hypothetical protein
LPALGSVRRSRRDGSPGAAFEIRDRAQELPAMPERRDTNLFEILIGQVTQNIEVADGVKSVTTLSSKSVR